MFGWINYTKWGITSSLALVAFLKNKYGMVRLMKALVSGIMQMMMDHNNPDMVNIHLSNATLAHYRRLVESWNYLITNQLIGIVNDKSIDVNTAWMYFARILNINNRRDLNNEYVYFDDIRMKVAIMEIQNGKQTSMLKHDQMYFQDIKKKKTRQKEDKSQNQYVDKRYGGNNNNYNRGNKDDYNRNRNYNKNYKNDYNKSRNNNYNRNNYNNSRSGYSNDNNNYRRNDKKNDYDHSRRDRSASRRRSTRSTSPYRRRSGSNDNNNNNKDKHRKRSRDWKEEQDDKKRFKRDLTTYVHKNDKIYGKDIDESTICRWWLRGNCRFSVENCKWHHMCKWCYLIGGHGPNECNKKQRF